jgi:DNA-binding NarL/FixJ family response regulator
LNGGGEVSHFWAAETLEKARRSQKQRWATLSPEQKRRLTVAQVRAMRSTLSNPHKEAARRAKIQRTMLDQPDRIAHGAARPNAKLDPQKVEAIRSLVRDGKSDQQIADIFQVSRRLIGDVRTGKRWRGVMQCSQR